MENAQKLIKKLKTDDRFRYAVKIENHTYYIEKRECQSPDGNYFAIAAYPASLGYPKGGDVAVNMGWDDYRYTHGGSIYRQAVELCNAIFEAL